MSRNINEITKEKILSFVEISKSAPLNSDKYIELKKEINILLKMFPYIKNIDMRYIDILLQKHTKKIYPRNDPGLNLSDSYDNYQKIFFSYLDTQKNQLNDLWMVIGANNSDTDLERFQNDYDITIGSITNNLNIHESKLITLDYNNIYRHLSKKLPYKFSKVIYDWSVTKFVKIFEDLPIIKELLSLYGVLYFDVIGGGGGIRNVASFREETDTYYLAGSDFGIYKPTYNEFGKSYISLNGKKIYNSYKLFDKIINGRIKKDILEGHILLNTTEESNFVNIDDRYINSVIQELKKIFTEDKFIVNHHKNSRTYPNNPIPRTPHAKIEYYYEIIRIAI